MRYLIVILLFTGCVDCIEPNKVMVDIIYGQSNACGRADNYDDYSTNPFLQIFNGGYDNIPDNSGFQPLSISTSNNRTDVGDHGLELELALHAEANQDTTYLIKTCRGGSAIPYFLPPDGQTFLQHEEDLQGLDLLTGNVYIRSVLYLQGETDASISTAQARAWVYGFQYIVDWYRGVVHPDIHIIVPHIMDYYEYAHIINRAIDSLSEIDNNISTLDVSGYATKDDGHYSSEGYATMIADYLATAKEIKL